MTDGSNVLCKSGTQIIDRAWSFMRTHVGYRGHSLGRSSFRSRVRSAQWCYWHQGEDLWAQTGAMLQSLLWCKSSGGTEPIACWSGPEGCIATVTVSMRGQWQYRADCLWEWPRRVVCYSHLLVQGYWRYRAKCAACMPMTTQNMSKRMACIYVRSCCITLAKRIVLMRYGHSRRRHTHRDRNRKWYENGPSHHSHGLHMFPLERATCQTAKRP